jgi:hypothetical protein
MVEQIVDSTCFASTVGVGVGTDLAELAAALGAAADEDVQTTRSVPEHALTVANAMMPTRTVNRAVRTFVIDATLAAGQCRLTGRPFLATSNSEPARPPATSGSPGGVTAATAFPPPGSRARWRRRKTRLYGGPMASVRKIQVTFDCAEPERVARFWCEVLGYVVPPPPDGFATWDDFDRALPPERQGSAFACTDPSGVGPRLFFQRVPEGKVVKNRVHLDVRVGTGLVGEQRLAALEAECARLVALGAVRLRLLPADDENESCIVMQDIEGNEFCLD